jgi:flagellar hook-basal body complex protein FliE
VSGLTPIQPIGLMGVMPTGLDGVSAAGGTSAAAGPGPAADGFAGMLSQAVGKLNTQLTQADSLQQAAATGQLSDPTVALVETEKADLSLQMATQVRNKLVEGWQELSRMSV